MQFRSLVLIAALVLVSGPVSASETARVRGELVWNSERQTLTRCGTEVVYWVRVLASNPHFWLSQRIKELSRDQPAGARIIADLEGDVSPVPSLGPVYSVDQVLHVRQFHSIELGACE
jgi:hypothetical protein